MWLECVGTKCMWLECAGKIVWLECVGKDVCGWNVLVSMCVVGMFG